MQGRGSYDGDNPPVFILADRGTGQRYVIPVIAVYESKIGFLLSNRTPASVIIYTDGFRTHEPLNEDDAFDREYVVYAEGGHFDKDVHANTCESHLESPENKLTQYLRAFQLRRALYRKWGRETLKHAI